MGQTQEVGVVVDDSRVGEKTPGMMEKYHKLSCRKTEIEEQIKRSNCADQKTSLTLELDQISRKINKFWNAGSHYSVLDYR